MSARLVVQSLIDAGVPELVNLCPTDARFYQYVNTFQERALSYGRWWGTTQLISMCVTSGCVVVPREVAVIEAMTFGGMPLQPRNEWYSYIRPHRPALCGSDNCSPGVYPNGLCGCGCGCGPFVSEDKLTVPSYASTTAGQVIRFYPRNAVDVGKKIIVQGRDENGVWVRTEFDGIVQDGEQVTLAMPFVDTTTAWAVGNPYAIIKEVTDYAVLMYAADGAAADDVAQQLSTYQPNETTPSYRKFYLPGYHASCGCDDDGTQTLRAIVSLNHVPVSQPNDWLLFQSIAAYEDGVQAVRHWREGDRMTGDTCFFGSDGPSRNGRGVLRTVKRSGALPTLQAELRKMTGDQTTTQVRRAGVNLVGFV